MASRDHRSGARRQAWLLLALGLGVGGLTLASLAFVMTEGLPLLWLSSGFAAGVIVAFGLRLQLSVVLVLLLALYVPGGLLGVTPSTALGYGLIHLLEIVLVVWGARRFGGRLMVVEEVLRSSLVAGVVSLLATGLTTVLAMALRWATRGPDAVDLGVALTWFTSHLTGMVVTAGLITVGVVQTRHWLKHHEHQPGLLAAWLLLLLALAGVFGTQIHALLFLPFLPVMWLAFRHGLPGALLAAATVAVASGTAAFMGRFAPAVPGLDPALSATLFPQLYAFATCLMVLPMAVVMTERARLAARLKRSEAHYRLMTEHARDLVVRLRADGSRSYVSEAARSLLGYAPDELHDPRRELFHPEDDPPIRALLAPLFVEAGSTNVQFRMRHREGHWVWLEALAVSVPAEQGEGFDIVYSARDISTRVAAEQALLAQARTDALTGLPNRREYGERLQRALQRARRSGLGVAVFALDLDHFKAINDELGHAAGDEALREFAARMRPQLRDADVLARLGGDEFALLMENLTHASECEATARRFLAGMRPPFRVSGEARVLGVSIGIAFGRGALDADARLEAADGALYRVKESGRGRYELVELGPAPAG
ncbi:sensor domain-containing diguanylate cyclase [Aquimonas voraii]|nr:sensor domain-containing diguanylate cyclase [Aquimonas voraii]